MTDGFVYFNNAMRSGGIYWNNGGALMRVNVMYNDADEEDGGMTLISGTATDAFASRTHGPLTVETNLAPRCAGGSVFSAHDASLHIRDSSFVQNVTSTPASTDGGALCVSTHANAISLSSSTMHDNRATMNGGAIAMIARPAPDGSGLLASRLLIDGVSFEDNTAGAGGAIHDDTTDCGAAGPCASLLVIRNSVFTQHRAFVAPGTGNGGVVHHRGNVTVLDSRFQFNSSDRDGGVLYVPGDSAHAVDRSVLVKLTTFLQNGAGRHGAIYTSGDTKVTVADSVFSASSGESISRAAAA